jgi:hypothetical protein
LRRVLANYHAKSLSDRVVGALGSADRGAGELEKPSHRDVGKSTNGVC